MEILIFLEQVLINEVSVWLVQSVVFLDDDVFVDARGIHPLNQYVDVFVATVDINAPAIDVLGFVFEVTFPAIGVLTFHSEREVISCLIFSHVRKFVV